MRPGKRIERQTFPDLKKVASFPDLMNVLLFPEDLRLSQDGWKRSPNQPGFCPEHKKRATR